MSRLDAEKQPGLRMIMSRAGYSRVDLFTVTCGAEAPCIEQCASQELVHGLLYVPHLLYGIARLDGTVMMVPSVGWL